MSYDSLQIYGISIKPDATRTNGISITSGESRTLGIFLKANNYFQGDIIVYDASSNLISGASVSIVSTITPITNLSGATDSNGVYTVPGISIINTTLTIEADGYNSYIGPLQSNATGDPAFTLALSTPSGVASKKIYTTNKGNVLINPNDTILIELN